MNVKEIDRTDDRQEREEYLVMLMEVGWGGVGGHPSLPMNRRRP